jgi:hypothetical protein
MKVKGTSEKKVGKFSIFKGTNNDSTKQAAFLFGYTCLGFGLLLGQVSTLFVVIFLVLMWFYPKKSKIPGVGKQRMIILGIASCLSFLIGFFTTSRTTKVLIFNYDVLVPVTTARPTLILILATFAIFCIFTLVFSLTQSKDSKK